MSTNENNVVSTQESQELQESQKIITLGGLKTFYDELKINHFDDINVSITDINNVIEENEEIVAVSLSDIDNRLIDLSSIVDSNNANLDTKIEALSSTVSNNKTELNAAIETLSKTVSDNKTELDDKINIINGDGDGSIKKTVNDAIASVIDSAPETLDTLKEVAEYIAADEQHAAEVTTTLSNHASAIQSLQDDNVIVKGDADNSAVLDGETDISGTTYRNRAISQTSMAVGAATIAGLKGWYYSAIDFTNKKITLSDRPTYILTNNTLLNGGWSSSTPNIKVNDVISLVNNSKYDLCSKVTAVNGNVITVDSLPFTELVRDNGAAVAVLAGQFSDGYSLYIPENPDAGIIDFGGGAFSEGGQSKASNICAHAEGLQTHAYGQYSHAEGRETEAGYAAHAEGRDTKAKGERSHAEGDTTISSGQGSHSEGKLTESSGAFSHAEGQYTKASGKASHSEGLGTQETLVEATGEGSHAEGNSTKASGKNSHAEGEKTIAYGKDTHAEGLRLIALGNFSHAEGGGFRNRDSIPTDKSTIESEWDDATQRNDTTDNGETSRFSASVGDISHVEGITNLALGNYSHAEGEITKAKGRASHAEGQRTVATGEGAHAEGRSTEARGANSHAEGCATKAIGTYSHAEGYSTETTNAGEHACGKYNKSTNSSDAAKATQFSIGIGTHIGRKNAVEVKANGDVYINGLTLPLATLLSSADTDADVESVWNEVIK